jgi:hypothetical protein
VVNSICGFDHGQSFRSHGVGAALSCIETFDVERRAPDAVELLAFAQEFVAAFSGRDSAS